MKEKERYNGGGGGEGRGEERKGKRRGGEEREGWETCIALNSFVVSYLYLV